MPLEKTCVQKGCRAAPIFGFGFPSKGKMRWACRAHRDLIWFAVPHPAAIDGGPAAAPGAPHPPSPSPRQERLL